jgi:hypothetical protein
MPLLANRNSAIHCGKSISRVQTIKPENLPYLSCGLCPKGASTSSHLPSLPLRIPSQRRKPSHQGVKIFEFAQLVQTHSRSTDFIHSFVRCGTMVTHWASSLSLCTPLGRHLPYQTWSIGTCVILAIHLLDKEAWPSYGIKILSYKPTVSRLSSACMPSNLWSLSFPKRRSISRPVVAYFTDPLHRL